MKSKIFKLLGILVLLLTLVTTVLADDGEIFRKNVSKTPVYETEHAALAMLPVYVPAQSSDGTLLTEGIIYNNVDGALVETRSEARPLISFYTDGPVTYIDEEGYGGFPGHGERDAYAAVSLDDGATWLRTNLSNSADLSSFKIKLGGRQKVPYPGDVGRAALGSDGNQILAVWVSRFAGGGSPNYAMSDTERIAVADYLAAEGLVSDPSACTDGNLIDTPCLYLEDHFGVAGSQGSSDLADEGFPLIGELPYAALWVARGVVLPPGEDGTSSVVWFKAERLSSAVRDANRPEVACAKGAGCVITWQEDPGGIRPGEGEGPGEGWSGAIAHHQTDTWYSYIGWDDFSLVSGDGTYGTFYNETGDLAEWVLANDTGRPQAAIPISIPVRISDNAMCTESSTDPYCHMDFDGSGTPDFCASTIPMTIETPEGPTQDINMCVAEDGRLMRGNTASTRARLSLHEYSSTEEYYFTADADNTAFFSAIDRAWFSMSYEESKGLGECDDEEDPFKIDMGKNVWYHTFDMFTPEVVSQGLMLNQPAVYPDDFAGESGVLEPDSLFDYNFYTIIEDPVYFPAGINTTLYQTEIARRPSPITQDWYRANYSETGTGTVAFQLWKQGIIRRGGPADIMGRAFIIPDGFDATIDNPYDYNNMACETWAFTDGTNPRYVKGFCAAPATNVSGNTVLTGETCTDALGCLDAFPFNVYFDDLDMSTTEDGLDKILTWQQYGPGYGETIVDTTLTNLDDASWENPYDVAKGHRGFLQGDMLMVMYAWSPNWLANTVGHDNYNLYNRRSFDGGQTWSTLPASFEHTNGIVYSGDGTTTCEWMGPAGSDTEYAVCTTYVAGEFEQARNVSQFVGTKETILDPRYTPAIPSITASSVTQKLPGGFLAPLYEDDTQDPSMYIMVYETGDNTTVAYGEAEPLDLYYSRAINWGDDYLVWAEDDSTCLPSNETESLYDLTGFCNEFDALEGSQFSESGEASITMSPGGQFFYALWNQVDFGVDGLSEDSDAWFRRVLFVDGYIPGESEPNGSPAVSINSPANNATFPSGTEIFFSADVSDPEGEDLSGTLVWTSSLDGQIGTGTSFTAQLSGGQHVITAAATDSVGNTGSMTISITVESEIPNEPPGVIIQSPGDGDSFTFGSLINFVATANDLEEGDLSADLLWQDNGAYLGAGASFSAVLDPGPHTIKATVVDEEGLGATHTIYIDVQPETPPSAKAFNVGVEVNQDIFYKGDTIEITLTVTDSDGAVEGALVEAFIDFPSISITKAIFTDANGQAVVRYKINTIKTGTGTAYVIATVTKDGYDPFLGELIATLKIS